MSKWVSVYDAIPDHRQWVLVYCKRWILGIQREGVYAVSKITRGGLFEIEQQSNEPWWTIGLNRVEVTHWMPLPDDPGEDPDPLPRRP